MHPPPPCVPTTSPPRQGIKMQSAPKYLNSLETIRVDHQQSVLQTSPAAAASGLRYIIVSKDASRASYLSYIMYVYVCVRVMYAPVKVAHIPHGR